MAKPGYQGLTRIIEAAGYSATGFRPTWRHESALREEVVLTSVLIRFAFWLGRDPVGDEPHRLSRRARDLCSAAVFVMVILAGILWLSVIIDHLG